jgi:hypothetical protein
MSSGLAALLRQAQREWFFLEQVHAQMADRGRDSGRVAFADAAGVFTEGDIRAPVQAILDPQVALHLVGDQALPLVRAIEEGAANLWFEAQRALPKSVAAGPPPAASVRLHADRFHPLGGLVRVPVQGLPLLPAALEG